MFYKLVKHKWFYIIISILLLGFWGLNYFVTLPFPGVLYWDYARHFQLSYLDSPFVLPLFIKLYSVLFGASALAFGYIKYLLMVATGAIVYAIGQKISGKKAALLCLLMFFSLPIMQKFFEHLDYHLLVIFLSSVILYFIASWHKTKARLNLYLGGVCLGLLLMTQFDSTFFVVSLMLASLCVSSYRKLWKLPAFYVSLILAGLVVIPFVVWQFNHNWLTLRYLSTSNNSGYDFSGFLSSLIDYIGSIALYFILMMAVLWKKGGLKHFTASSRFFFYVWLFCTLLFNVVFMHNAIRHTVLISANMALFLFLASDVYEVFPKATILVLVINGLITIGLITTNMTLMYQNNYLSFAKLLNPLIDKQTLVISNVTPFDNAPSYFSIMLKGQPEIYALKNAHLNLHNKGNPGVYLWQPTLKILMKEKPWHKVLFLTNEQTVPARLQAYVQCAKPRIITLDYRSQRSFRALMTHGWLNMHNTLYAYQCVKHH